MRKVSSSCSNLKDPFLMESICLRLFFKIALSVACSRVFVRSSGHVNSRQKTACLRHDSAFLADTAVINNVSRVLISNVRSARWCHMQLVISVFFIDQKKNRPNKLHTEQSRHDTRMNQTDVSLSSTFAS